MCSQPSEDNVLKKWISKLKSQSPKHVLVCLPLMRSGKLLSTGFMNAAHSTSVTQQFLLLGWWALFTAPLPFCLKVLGFHQLKTSRQGQGRWMTSMASRYFQGRVIETNEPCYISWDTESCCSKIQSLIELKLEAPNLSTDHRCHGAPEEELSQRACFTGLAPCFYLGYFCFLLMWVLFYEQVHTHIHRHTHSALLFGLQRFSESSFPGAESKLKGDRAII